jgi:hypothetical protein
VTALCGISVTAMLIQHKGVAATALVFVGLTLGYVLTACGYFCGFTEARLLRPHFAVANSFAAMQKEKLQLTRSTPEVFTLINQTCIEFGVINYSINIGTDFDQIAEFAWNRSTQMQGKYLATIHVEPPVLFSDGIDVEGIVGSGTWTMEANHRPEDIDFEYRALIKDFMRVAICRACELGVPNDGSQSSSHQSNVTSAHLKRRAQSEKQRKGR